MIYITCTQRYISRTQKQLKNETGHACLVVTLKVITLRWNKEAPQLQGKSHLNIVWHYFLKAFY